MEQLNTPKLLTTKEAAELLSVHPNTLRRWCNEGLIEFVRFGKRGQRRFRLSVLDMVISNNHNS